MFTRAYGVLAFVVIALLLVVGIVVNFIFTSGDAVKGVYVFHNEQSVAMLEFQQTDNDNLVAELQSVELQADGHLLTRRGLALGSVKDGQIILNLRMNGSYGTSFTYSGTVEKNALILTFSMAGKALARHEFAREGRRLFSVQEKRLKDKALVLVAAAKSEQVQANLLRGRDAAIQRLNEVSANLQKFYASVDEQVDKAKALAAGFEHNTQRSKALYPQVAALTEVQARSDKVFELGRVVDETEQVNLAVNRVKEDVFVLIRVVNIGIVDAEQTCTNYKADVAQLQAWCESFEPSKAAFLEKSQQVQAQFAELAKTYQQELQKQNILARDAENLLE